MRGRWRRAAATAAVLALLVAGCSEADAPEPPDAQTPPASTDSSAGSLTDSSTTAPTSAPHPVSLPALRARHESGDLTGSRLRLGREVLRTPRHTQYDVTYRAGGLRLTGRIAVPEGPGPFPVVVLAHGYIDPDRYAGGQGLTRERAWFGERGYVALHVDYRGHAGSADGPLGELDMRMGYTEDVIGAVQALRAWDGPVDDERIGLVGRSMGGGVVYNALVVAPGLVDAGVVFAPVSSRAEDNFEQWIRPDPARSGVARRILRTYGEPAANPAFWDGISARTYFVDLTEPVLVHHGTADDTCPIAWSRATVRAMRRAGVDVTFEVYQGEGHAFGPQFEDAMQRTETFLRTHLR
ncbi:alpha/beta hydrolase family protein [Nocardioides faecalis]|uniref:alpha/beta hydrolase family protein n=1 Tax=Nocardioides faecalis TaxID=2803858 RepID=UPI0020BE5EC7|nr:prolyl oligopeptidase family serine peptidase [Nocardioides faecalis]